MSCATEAVRENPLAVPSTSRSFPLGAYADLHGSELHSHDRVEGKKQ